MIGIGREWGHIKSAVPHEQQAHGFLSFAYDLGIRYFDTAPSYGASEERLGTFLHALDPEKRQGITVATKFGEHWDDTTQSAYADHSYPALQISIDQSLARLGTIDILQVHKTSPVIIASPELHRAIAYAKEKGIERFGASVSDLESARLVCESDLFSTIQLPFNQANQKLPYCYAIWKEFRLFLPVINNSIIRVGFYPIYANVIITAICQNKKEVIHHQKQINQLEPKED